MLNNSTRKRYVEIEIKSLASTLQNRCSGMKYMKNKIDTTECRDKDKTDMNRCNK